MKKQVIRVILMILIISSLKCSHTAANMTWIFSPEQMQFPDNSRLFNFERNNLPSDFKHNRDTRAIATYNPNLFDGYYDYGYGYEYTDEENVTFDIVDDYLNTSRTRTFLSSFQNHLQREAIRQQLRYCPYVRLCNFSLGLEILMTSISCCAACNCDFPSCLTYKSCCPDILPSSMFRLSSEDDEMTYKPKNYSRDTNAVPLTCTLLHAKRIFPKAQLSVYAYASCPSGTDKKLDNLCTRQYTKNLISIEDMVPVTTVASRVTYRNKYCALCNGVSENETEFWDLSLSCNISNTNDTFIQSEKLLIDFLFSNDICDLRFVGQYLVRKCKTAVSRCNETGLWKKYDPKLDLSCSLYISNVYAFSRMYKNIFCLKCNGYEPKLPFKECYMGEFGISFSFSGLIKVKSFTATENKKQVISTCNESSIYDKTTGKCMPRYCSEFHRLQNQKCVKIFDSIGPMIYVLYLRFIPVQTTTIDETHLLTEDIINYIQMYVFNDSNYFPITKLTICGVQLVYRANLTFLGNNSDDVTGSNLINIDARFELSLGQHDPYKVTQSLNTLDKLEIFIGSQQGQREMKFRIIVRDDSFNLDYDIVAVLTQMESYVSSEDVKTDDIVPLSELIKYSASDGDKYTLIPYISRNNQFKFCMMTVRKLKAVAIRDCPVIKLPVTDSSLKEIDDEISFVYKNLSFFQSEFSFENNRTILICVEAFRRYLNQTQAKVSDTSNISDIEELLSIIFSILSLICLSITLFAFALFPSLRTFPGMNTVCLCLFLLAAQSLYLIASFAIIKEQTIWCQAVGIMLHFSWLATLFWMNICTFHMFQVLTHTRARSTTKWRLFAIYHIYTFVLSCSCIVINIGLSLYFSNNIGYGKEICYISSDTMTMYTFGLPVLLVVLANITMFSAVVLSVKRTSSIHRTCSDERNDILIFVKLSSLTGVTWIFGIIYYWTGLSVFSYIFIILNSSQGVFLMLSFVTNKRIRDLYKTRIQKWRKRHWAATGTYNMTSLATESKTTMDTRNLRTKYKHTETKNVLLLSNRQLKSLI